MALHISISAEPIFHIGSVTITNSVFTSWIVTALLIILALIAHSQYKETKRPKGLQNLLEIIIGSLHNLTQEITNDSSKTRVIFPITATFFIFILCNNWFGLLPGSGTIGLVENSSETVHAQSLITTAQASDTIEEVTKEAENVAEEVVTEPHSPQDVVTTGEDTHQESTEHTKFVPIIRAGTADLNTTIALALMSVVLTQVIGVKYLGLSYFQKFFNIKQGPIYFFVGILEIVSEFSKIISYAFRLFGNIFAGEVLLAVIAFLIPIFLPIPFYGLEVFVGFIQALVFTMLSIVFMSMATHGHAEEH